ncbi:MAG TPA: transcription-repair coupling factor [Syntrophales bacterium]|nr:transcription-repair coupling factor [Syntrophales bacterium]
MEKKPEKTVLRPAEIFEAAADGLDRGKRVVRMRGLRASGKAMFLAFLFSRRRKTMLVLCESEKEAEAILRDLSFFLGTEEGLLYPPWDLVTTDMFAVQKDAMRARMNVLALLADGGPRLVVAPLSAAAQKILPRRVFDGYGRFISIGDTIGRDELTAALREGGYARVTLVEERGEFSIRGHIADIYPMASDFPYRLEFFGDELETIRPFDPATQRSRGEAVEFFLYPAADILSSPERLRRAAANVRHHANEIDLPGSLKSRLVEAVSAADTASVNPLFGSLFYESWEGAPSDDGPMASLFDYLPRDAVVALDDPSSLERGGEEWEKRIAAVLGKAERDGRFRPPGGSFSLGLNSLRAAWSSFAQVVLEDLPVETPQEARDREEAAHTLRTETDFFPGVLERQGKEADRPLLPVAEKIREWLEEGDLVAFVCPGEESLQNMDHLLAGHGLSGSRPSESLLELIRRHEGHGRLLLYRGAVSKAFRIPSLKLAVLSEEEIFGRKVRQRKRRPQREGYFLQSFGELKEGDFIVHRDHGIGLYRGLQKVAAGGIENDYLLIEYQEGDRLYIPVDRLDVIQRYIGPEGHQPRIERLGGASWEAAKEKVKASVRKVAEELVSIYAVRQVVKRDPFSKPDRLYEEFCSAFEFEETPDQMRAVEEVHLDMAEEKPMDRLVCGDAGFGKTEVALRAAFRAVMDGKQAAVLVPTTILAEQHYETFARRMAPFPIRVEVLNRFKTKAETAAILEGLQKGTVDIVVGTHRLLQKDVHFKDLGLVVVDEEQRFGVVHKERLKKVRALVDVLTLSATPIPRTLHLSLVGIRDLSIINTPPEDRRPIKTHVLEFDEDVIRDAIRRELGRGGRVFFLHDRVRSIYGMARFVERVVPEARVGVVHGQMKPRDIENAMSSFVRGRTDVLVCTTIVSAGLDIPTANTIIIHRADCFGLSQLYQMRGRVGRSREDAYAYLLVPRGAMLSRDAQKRLQVIMDFSEPGSGFRIASSDLDIRGAGNLLGTSQSGHISAVGYELYTELMESAIREIKGEAPEEEEIKPEIQLGLSAYLPEGYMEDVHLRLVTYKRLSMAGSDEEIAAIREELTDCYGLVPPEAEHLFGVIRIRNRLKSIQGKRMMYDGKRLSIVLHGQSSLDPLRILQLARKEIRGIRLEPDLRLSLPMPDLKGRDLIEAVLGFLRTLTALPPGPPVKRIPPKEKVS